MSNNSNDAMPGLRKMSYPTITYLSSSPGRPEEKMVFEGGTCQPLREEKISAGKQLQLTKYHFKDAHGTARSSEGVQVVSKLAVGVNGSGPKSQSKEATDNLCTIAILRRLIMCDALVLVKQYRAPLKAYTLEFPATVIDHLADVRELANKEIEDDTGYSSTKIKYISPLTSLEPDVSDGKLQLVDMTIDGDDPIQHATPRNNYHHSIQKGGHGDIVQVLQVPVNGLLDRLEAYSQQGVIVDSRVYAFAIGFKKGEKLVVNESVVTDELAQ